MPLRADSTSRQRTRGPLGVYFVHDPSFERAGAETTYTEVIETGRAEKTDFMPDEVTRAVARAMHYAAWRASGARTNAARCRWYATYLSHRDRIVVGNRKLIYRAVSRWMPPSQYSDDMTGDCQIVLIQAVAAYNPWLGIRFSTYAFTCLMRGLSRLSQRHANDRLARSLPLDALPDGEPRDTDSEDSPTAHLQRIDEFLQDHHELLSTREKKVLIRRFSLDDKARVGTLEQVGRELGLSKERVRQVQASALSKLRRAMAHSPDS